ncbi:uncharacterized protein LOC127850555 [Dreissena polymorpha]|uniref:Complex I-B14.7 n=1 Tax=Dreissena polymorpha TaxID=45954 RepID=A0A9D4CUZ1_DREPO|nr:uncharacterized protein LOC127850555 [Dreissena polymorpha]KAH3733832.1 hypothetical protein DPMN_040269 [Dreissena polymorpha]
MGSQRPLQEIEEQILFPKRNLFYFKHMVNVHAIPEQTIDRLSRMRAYSAMAFGSKIGFVYGVYREFVYGKETVKEVVQKRKIATFAKPVGWIIAGAALGGWYYLCTENIARFRGKQDYLNNFFAGYGMAAPFAVLRRSPQMLVVAGTLWGVFFALARSSIDIDGLKYFNRKGYVTPPQYPEAFVLFEGMMAEDEDKERKRMLAIEEWRRNNAGKAA